MWGFFDSSDSVPLRVTHSEAAKVVLERQKLLSLGEQKLFTNLAV
jgi:hypothetical protein